jgi:hypothetical protein
MNPRRLVMVLVVMVMVAAVAAINLSTDTPEPADSAASQTALSRLGPTVADAAAGSSTWYCAAGTATGTADGQAEQTVVIANITDTDRTATVTAYSDTGQVASDTVDVPGHSRTQVRVAELITADWAGVLVEADGGGVAVDHLLAGPSGSTAGPCAS